MLLEIDNGDNPPLVLALSFSTSGRTASWNAFLDGSTLPDAPWIEYKDGPDEERGDTMVVDFVDPAISGTNQALRINSGNASTEWYVGALFTNEIVAAARFRWNGKTLVGRKFDLRRSGSFGRCL